MTERLAVLGRPVAHSRSPEIHQLFAAQVGLDISYEKLLVPEGRFRQTALDFLGQGRGCNITLPCKHDAFLLADEVSAGAAKAEAVNTLSKMPDARLRGDNTDGAGLVTDLVQNLGWEVAGCRVLVLGAGGAVSGILPSLVEAKPAKLHVHNRTHHKAVSLVTRQGHPLPKAVTDSQLEAGYDLIISGTSAGLANEAIEVPVSIVATGSHCYDMIYGKEGTPFLQWCKAQADCETADGLGMLVEQAALAFQIWFGQMPNTKPVINALSGAGHE